MARNKTGFSAEQIAAVATCLRETRDRTRRLLAANDRWLTQLEHRRNHPLPPPELRRLVAGLHFPQKGKLRELIEADPRSRLLVSYHFGDYIYGLNLLGAGIGDRAKVYYLSQARGSDGYFQNIRRAFGNRAQGPESQLIVDESDISTLAPLLRSPGVQFVTFCDLTGQFGDTAGVDFLQRPACFPRGPALLSLTNRIPMLPVINWFDGDRVQIVLGEQLEPERIRGESLAAASDRLTAALTRFFEPFFRTSPEQWRYLGALPLYFIQPGAPVATQPQETSHANPQQDIASAGPLQQ